jgi:hypothetical protein
VNSFDLPFSCICVFSTDEDADELQKLLSDSNSFSNDWSLVVVVFSLCDDGSDSSFTSNFSGSFRKLVSTIDYPQCSKMNITDQSEIIGDSDLLPEKDFPSMKMKFVDNMKSIVSYGITNASDMRQDTLQMPGEGISTFNCFCNFSSSILVCLLFEGCLYCIS